MLSVVIVEKGNTIKRLLQSSRLGWMFNIVDFVSSYDEALKLIMGLRPEVVLCLDEDVSACNRLIESVWPYSPETAYIICGGNREYELIKEAMDSGACAYIPFPMVTDDFESELERIYRRYEQRKQLMSSVETEKSKTAIKRILDKKFFEDVIVGGFCEVLSDPKTIREQYGLSLEHKWYQCLNILIDPRPQEEIGPDAFLPVLQLEQIARDHFGKYFNELIIYVKDRGMTIILFGNEDIDVKAACRKFLSRCRRELIWYSKQNTISIGVGLKETNIERLITAVDAAKYANWNRLTHGLGNVIFFQEESFEGINEALTQGEKSRLTEAVMSLSITKCNGAVEDILDTGCESAQFISRAIAVNNVLIDAINSAASSSVVKNSKFIWLAENMPPMVENYDSLYAIRNAIEQWLQKALIMLTKDDKEEGSADIKAAKLFIRRNCGKQIKLTDAAGAAGLTPAYFSSKFKQKTRMTFIEYLTDVRIDEACELLKSTNKKIYEVSTAVGFTDSRHFSRVFIKKKKLTPTEYRDKYYSI